MSSNKLNLAAVVFLSVSTGNVLQFNTARYQDAKYTYKVVYPSQTECSSGTVCRATMTCVPTHIKGTISLA